jgi:hypothetical protein
MAERWAGITSSSTGLILVSIEYNEERATVIHDLTWQLQKGARSDAYRVLYETVLNYLRETGIRFVALKGTALNSRGMRAWNLEAAELRGAVMVAASQSGAEVTVATKAIISRKFGERNVDDYVADDGFWNEHLGDQLRKGSRETALLILAARKR